MFAGLAPAVDWRTQGKEKSSKAASTQLVQYLILNDMIEVTEEKTCSHPWNPLTPVPLRAGAVQFVLAPRWAPYPT